MSLSRRCRLRNQSCVHHAGATQHANLVVDGDVAPRGAKLRGPFQPLGLQVVVRSDEPSLEVDRRQPALGALLVCPDVSIFEALKNGIGIELLVVTDISGRFEIEDRKPFQVLRSERVTVLAREIVHQSEEFVGLAPARNNGLWERQATPCRRPFASDGPIYHDSRSRPNFSSPDACSAGAGQLRAEHETIANEIENSLRAPNSTAHVMQSNGEANSGQSNSRAPHNHLVVVRRGALSPLLC